MTTHEFMDDGPDRTPDRTPDRPREELLAAAASGELSPDALAALESRLSEDPAGRQALSHLRTEVAALRSDDAVDPPPAVIERAREIFTRLRENAVDTPWTARLVRAVAELLFDSRAEPQLAGFRGAGDAYRLTFGTDELELDLQVDPSAVDGGSSPTPRCRIMGQLIDDTAEATSVRFVDHASGAVSVECAPDETGVFDVRLDPGCYDLLVQRRDGVVAVEALELP